MKRSLDVLRHLGGSVVGAFFSFILWTLWLALAALLCLQLYIVTARELAIPDFVLRQLEARLAESGLRATFQHTSFDPTGRVLMKGVRLSVAGFADPVVTADAIYVQLNPLALIVGTFEPSEIRVMDAKAILPAPLTQTGRPEEILTGVNLMVAPAPRLLTIPHASGRLAGIEVLARGTVPLPRRAGDKPFTATIGEFVSTRFPQLARQMSALATQLDAVERPSVQLEFSPSESGALAVAVSALAKEVKLAKPVVATVRDMRASTRLLLLGERPPTHIEMSAAEVRLSGPEATVRGVHAAVHGQFRPDGGRFDLREVTATADSISAAGTSIEATSALFLPRLLPRLDARITTRFLGEPLALRTSLDLDAQSGEVQFDGALSPSVLELISARVRVNVRKYYEFDALRIDRAEARFGPKWTFERLSARVRIPRMNSYGVVMEDGIAAVELTPGRFWAPEAFARIGDNFARGTYEHDLKTQHYRFLLDGRLRPMEISPWFRAWWPNFFQQLEFVASPPQASVDVQGMWRDGRHANVFVFADAGKSVIRGTTFDRVRTRLFIRPAFFDGLELRTELGTSAAQGRFTLVSDPVSHDWQSLDLALDSNLDLKVIAQMLGANGGALLAPFSVATPPTLKVRGNFAGPAAPGAKDSLRIDVRTTGEFRFHHFPLQDASFAVALEGDDIVIDELEALFAGGVVGGHARVWGTPAQRRLGFDVSLQDATLGQVAAQVQGFLAAQKNVPPPPPGKFVKEKANVRLDFAASAEGLYRDAFSYRGGGNVALRGAEIGEVHLLGALSELLKFTSLRFTEARSNFKIEGPKIAFREVELRGANSAIDAHGDYLLDRRTLDFNAKIFPFQESENIIKSVVGAVLTPLSNALEVKLTGSLEKPEWAFVMGPTNFLRSLAEGGDNATNPPSAVPPSQGAPPGPPKITKP